MHNPLTLFIGPNATPLCAVSLLPWVRRGIIFLLLSFLFTPAYPQQKRVAAIGSSTTAGGGASTPDSSWFIRFLKYYGCTAGVVDSAHNYATYGVSVYTGMPSGFQPPANRPYPNDNINVSRAINFLHTEPQAENGVILVNYPSNGYNVYSIAEVLDCLQAIYDAAVASGNRCFITTTQPRCDGEFATSYVKRRMFDLKDSIIARFGEAHTINFWDGMYNPADTTIRSEFSAGDNIHFNDAGHRELFQRVVAKNVFALPVWYSKPDGYLNELQTWGSNADGSGAAPVSFSGDNQVFRIVNNPQPSISADWTLTGRNIQVVVGNGTDPIAMNIPEGLQVRMISPAGGSGTAFCP